MRRIDTSAPGSHIADNAHPRRGRAAASVDDHESSAWTPSAGPTAGDVEELRAERRAEGWRNGVATTAEWRRRRFERGWDEVRDSEGAIRFEDLPDDLAQKVVQLELPPTALTNQDATLLALSVGGGPIQLPFVRHQCHADRCMAGPVASTGRYYFRQHRPDGRGGPYAAAPPLGVRSAAYRCRSRTRSTRCRSRAAS